MKERIVRYTVDELRSMPSLTDWDRIRNMKDEDIDFSDLPELTDEQLATATHIKYFENEIDYDKMPHTLQRSVNKPTKQENLKKVMIRLDNNTLTKLKTLGRGWSSKVRTVIQDWVNRTVL